MNNVMSQEEIYNHYTFAPFSKYKIKKILELLPKKQGLKLLDVGCGEGYFFDHIKDLNYEYSGMDISNEQVKKAKNKGLNVIKYDASVQWPQLDKTYDVVFASEIIEHVFDTDFFLHECSRVLKGHGILLLTTPNIAYLGSRVRLLCGRRPPVIDCRADKNTSGHIRAFTYYDLKKLFEDHDFIIERYSGLNFYLPFISEETKGVGFISHYLSYFYPKLSSGLIFKCTKKGFINHVDNSKTHEQSVNNLRDVNS